jgi:O-methyltransferase domain/Dimerisation domain
MTERDQNVFAARLRRQIEAYHETALVHAAVKLGLPDRLATGPLTAEQLAAALGLSVPHLHRFLRGLCTIGICEEHVDGTFALTTGGQCLTSDSPSRLAAKVQIVVGQYWRPWAKLVSALQTGTPAFDEVFGRSVFDWRREHPEQGALFAAYLAKETQADTESILAALDLSESDRVVRFDAPDAALPADIPSGADLYLLNGVLQNCDDQGAAVILRKCRAAMEDGARLAIVERLMPERASDDPAAVMLDLHMMTITGGRARSLAEFEVLLAEAGLMLTRTTATPSGLTLIEAMPR